MENDTIVRNQYAEEKAADAGVSTQTTRILPSFSKLTIIILIVAALGAILGDAFFGDSGMFRMWQLQDEYQLLLGQVDTLEKENQYYLERIERLKNSPLAIETVAREEYNLAMPDEDVFIFPYEPEPVIQDVSSK